MRVKHNIYSKNVMHFTLSLFKLLIIAFNYKLGSKFYIKYLNIVNLDQNY